MSESIEHLPSFIRRTVSPAPDTNPKKTPKTPSSAALPDTNVAHAATKLKKPSSAAAGTGDLPHAEAAGGLSRAATVKPPPKKTSSESAAAAAPADAAAATAPLRRETISPPEPEVELAAVKPTVTGTKKKIAVLERTRTPEQVATDSLVRFVDYATVEYLRHLFVHRSLACFLALQTHTSNTC